jgi:hypothetical protein
MRHIGLMLVAFSIVMGWYFLTMFVATMHIVMWSVAWFISNGIKAAVIMFFVWLVYEVLKQSD